jgi:uncharacterized protein (TIGR02271 family)
MVEHIVAIFESNASAAGAAQSLADLGIPASAVRQYAGGEMASSRVDHAAAPATHSSGGGFWSWLFGEESVTATTASDYGDDIDAYDRRAKAGNFVLSVTVDDDTKIHQVITILEAHDPIDIDEHTEGDPSTGVATAVSTGASGAARTFSSGNVAKVGAVGSTTPSGRVDGVNGSEEVIPLSEEKLEVGKRTVDRGATRIRRYVVEKPAEENVTLRGERVTVERRTPIEAVTPGAGTFEERTVEVRETTEEPVVAKTARVVEEVVVGREATERTETVKDKVRREEVEISGDGKAGGVGP